MPTIDVMMHAMEMQRCAAKDIVNWSRISVVSESSVLKCIRKAYNKPQNVSHNKKTHNACETYAAKAAHCTVTVGT